MVYLLGFVLLLMFWGPINSFRKKLSEKKYFLDSLPALNELVDKYSLSTEDYFMFHFEPFPFEKKLVFIDEFDPFKRVCENSMMNETIPNYKNIMMIYHDYIYYCEYLKEFDTQTINNGLNYVNQSYYFRQIVDNLKINYFDTRQYNDMIESCENAFFNLAKNSVYNKIELPITNYLIENFDYYKNNRDIINKNFMNAEKIKYKDFFENIDGKSLDDQQRNAVVNGENNLMVIAGAGGGKTLTIAAKVLYLTQYKNIDPSEILLLSFTKKAADELTFRIKETHNIQIAGSTFHGLSNRLIRQIEDISSMGVINNSDIEKVINDYLNYEISKKPDVLNDLIMFLSLYIYLPYILESENTLKDIMDFSRTLSSQTLTGLSDKNNQTYLSHHSALIKKLQSLKHKYYNSEVAEKNEAAISIIKTLKKIPSDLVHAETINWQSVQQLSELDDFISNELASVDLDEILSAYSLASQEEIDDLISTYELMIDNLLELKSIIRKSKSSLLSLKGNRVKSHQELLIANFLFINGINYEYESDYLSYLDIELDYRYRPDFFLPDYEIYLEHFGIDENGKLPWLDNVEEQKYIENMKSKRALHEKNNTILVESYSFEVSSSDFFKNLKEKLESFGVEFKKINQREILEIIKDSNVKNDSFNDYKKLLRSFLSSFRGENYKLEDLDILIDANEEMKNDVMKMRSNAFIRVFKDFYKYYMFYKKETNKIDFDDMIIGATNLVENHDNLDINYKYIIVDEYQDISKTKVELIQSIINRTGSNLMCVGDDWQAIYGFAGSDVNYFLNFSKYYGYTETVKIEKTYRNSQELINVAGKFVMENPVQIKKNLISPKRNKNPIIDVSYDDDDEIRAVLYKMDTELNEIVSSSKLYKYAQLNKVNLSTRVLNKPSYHKTEAKYIVEYSDFNSKLNQITKICIEKGYKDLLVLGRQNNSIAPIIDGYLPDFEISESKDGIRIKSLVYKNKIKINYMTVHKSKGTEASAVAIIGVEDRINGFPNKMVDDVVLSLLKSNDQEFRYAEERRLFYVALTRTKNEVFILYKRNNPSIFISELFKNSNKENDEDSQICPRCNVGNLVYRSGAKTGFVGCSEYPQCSYTHNSLDILHSKIRCPACNGYLLRRNPKPGDSWKSFYACSNYSCKATYNISINAGKETISLHNKSLIKETKPIGFNVTSPNIKENIDYKIRSNDQHSLEQIGSFYLPKEYLFLLDQNMLDIIVNDFNEDTEENKLSLSEINSRELQKNVEKLLVHSNIELSSKNVNTVKQQALVTYIEKNKIRYKRKASTLQIFLELERRLKNLEPFNRNPLRDDQYLRSIEIMGKVYSSEKFMLRNNIDKLNGGKDDSIWELFA